MSVELKWVGKKRGFHNANINSDVSVAYYNTRNQIAFTFRKNSYRKITLNDYIIAATTGNRVYFKQADTWTGFKLTCFRNENSSCEFKVLRNFLDFKSGDYILEYDEEQQLYYIDANKSL